MGLGCSSVVESPVTPTDNANINVIKRARPVCYGIDSGVCEDAVSHSTCQLYEDLEEGAHHFIGIGQASPSSPLTFLLTVIMRNLLRGLKCTNTFL